MAEFGDPFAALAALRAMTGTMPRREYRNRLLVMVARQHEMTDEERAAEARFRKLRENRRRQERFRSRPRDAYTREDIHERAGGRFHLLSTTLNRALTCWAGRHRREPALGAPLMICP
ncbi:hypothetical protein AB0I10_40080 [Streptomyces sp. NPDC050636]|uniref:hypothetical protein n=1 Tax=Streptomyces sp. NPDC050636 TaxID=3154510 RepID=UPI00342714AA